MDTVLQDLRYALRQLRASPGFTLAALLTLALGIGANTAIFSVVDGVLLRPAPFEDMDRLVMVWETDRKSGTMHEPASVPDYLDFQRRSTRFEQLAAFNAGEVNLTPEAGEPRRLAAVGISYEWLPALGIRPLLGRGFAAEDDRPGAPNVVLIGEELWQQHYARDPDVIGRQISINDVPRQIIGVLPRGADFGLLQVLKAADYSRGFADRGGASRVDVWAPLRPNPAVSPRSNHPIFVIGRLSAGATVATAQQEFDAIAADLERIYPENDARGAHLEPLEQVVFGPVRPALLVLLGAVVLVLLIACANVANLLLVRGTARLREITVRSALGAGMGRLARQFLVEGALLAVCGAALGIVLAFWGLDLLVALAPADIPRVGRVAIDGRVLAASLAITVAVALLFGLLPALQARRHNLQSALQGAAGRGGSAGREHRRFRSVLVAAELGLAVMLMIGAGLLIKSLARLQRVDPGFSTTGVVKAQYQLPPSRYPRDFSKWPRWPETHRFNLELRSRLAALPGVEHVAIAGSHPLDAGFTSSIAVVGREPEAADWPEPSIRLVSPGYFETVQVPLRAGRLFAESEDVDAPPVVLINEAAQRIYFAGHDPLGQRIQLWGAARRVVGVVGDERIHGLANPTPPGVYLPLTQATPANGAYSVLARVSRAPDGFAPTLRQVARGLDPALPLFDVEPLAATLSNSLGQRRFTMLVLGIFAGVALILAIVGVHGVLSYMVAQRTREIGIRVALGARPRAVRALVVTHGARLT
ncbi:MAG: ABC transporter permease, partial [Gemmatimonadales bacterium]